MARRKIEVAWPSILLFGAVMIFFAVTSLMFFVPHCSPLVSSEELPAGVQDAGFDSTWGLEDGIDDSGDLP